MGKSRSPCSASLPLADFGASAKDHAAGSWPMSAYVLLSSVLVRNPESRVSLSYIADHTGGSQSESSPHTRSANALADGVASQVASARRFNIRVMLRIEKTEALTKTML